LLSGVSLSQLSPDNQSGLLLSVHHYFEISLAFSLHMELESIQVTKANGFLEPFSVKKLRASLSRSGADEDAVNHVLLVLESKLYPGIKTREIYKLAHQLLKRKVPGQAARFGLKKAIMELGPSGFPFEHLIGELFANQGFKTEVGVIISGKCVSHEIDVVATRGNELALVECKYRNHPGFTIDVKIPLYINSRFQDLLDNGILSGTLSKFAGWLATNARFSDDAIAFSNCKGIQLLGWNYPEGKALKDWIDKSGLYPITCLTTLTNSEKGFLLEKNVVLVKNLSRNRNLLEKAGVAQNRIQKVMMEIEHLLNQV